MAKLAVFGINTPLFRHFLGILADSGIKKTDIALFSGKKMGEEISFGEEDLIFQDPALADWSEFDRAIFIQDEALAITYALNLKKVGIRVINATEALRDIDDLALDSDYLQKGKKTSQSLPSPMVAAFLKVLQPLQKAQIKAVRLSAYIGVDMWGDEGMNELYNATRRMLMNDTQTNKGIFAKQPAFNVLPQAGSFIGEETEVEWLFNTELKQTLGADVKVHANCATVPVFVGMGAFANIETKKEIDIDNLRKELQKLPTLRLLDEQNDGGYAAITDAQGEVKIYVSRLREDMSVKNGISLWWTADVNMAAANDIANLVKQHNK